jgi:hypothetical protein
MSTLVFHLLFNHSKTSTKKMDSNVLCWDVQCVSKFGYIIYWRYQRKQQMVGSIGNREGVRRSHCDCKCQFHDLSNPNPNCIYLTMGDINLAKKRKQDNEDAGIEYYRSISMYDIRNALTEKSLPLSDNIHGPYKMMPPELLHTSGSGLIIYMLNHLGISWEVEKTVISLIDNIF